MKAFRRLHVILAAIQANMQLHGMKFQDACNAAPQYHSRGKGKGDRKPFPQKSSTRLSKIGKLYSKEREARILHAQQYNQGVRNGSRIS